MTATNMCYNFVGFRYSHALRAPHSLYCEFSFGTKMAEVITVITITCTPSWYINLKVL